MARFNNTTAKSVIWLILEYQYWISPMLGSRCRFYPSCSGYAKVAISRFGILKGGLLSIQRMAKCHPWHKGGVDFPPNKESL